MSFIGEIGQIPGFGGIIGGGNAYIGDNGNWYVNGIDTGVSATGTVADHTTLTGRDEADQHTISSITGLNDAIDEKQDVIDDLADIRSGAELGATSIQPEDYSPEEKTPMMTQPVGVDGNGKLWTVPGGSGGGGAWGSITGTLSNQTDLQDALDAKQDTIADLADIRTGAGLGASAYQKPGTGIPKSDLDSDVQTSLGLADTALQTHQDISGKADSVSPTLSGTITMGGTLILSSAAYGDTLPPDSEAAAGRLFFKKV